MTIEPTPELLSMARRLVWFMPPEEALKQPYVFLAQVMTLGGVDDVLTVRHQLGTSVFAEVLDSAPAGVFDPRSWSYWNLMCDRWPPPPLPERHLP